MTAAIAIYFAWWLLWQGIVSMLLPTLLDLPDATLGLFTILGGLAIWAVLALLMGMAFYLVARRWPVPARTWVAVGAVGLVLAGMWLFTVASVHGGTDGIGDFARLGLEPLVAMTAATCVGTRCGSKSRIAHEAVAFEQARRADAVS